MTNLEIFNRLKARVAPKPQGDLRGIIDRSIQTIEIPSVSSIGKSAFQSCTKLTSVIIPDSVTSIGDSAFYDCTRLTSVTIPNSVTSIEARAFHNCSSLTSVTIGNSVVMVGAWAFDGCKSLTSIEIPDSVKTIGDFAFQYCTSLTIVTLPNSVTIIGNTTFQYCRNLENVTFENGFNCSGLNLSASTKFSVDTMIAMFNALADRTGLSAYKLTLGNTNLAKLSNEQIAIATEKNWTLA